jgi:hypothetical protein
MVLFTKENHLALVLLWFPLAASKASNGSVSWPPADGRPPRRLRLAADQAQKDQGQEDQAHKDQGQKDQAQEFVRI